MTTAQVGIIGMILVGSSFAFADDLPSPAGNGDVNGDGTINITDAVYLLTWQFLDGPPPAQIPSITLAPTVDDLRPERHADALFSGSRRRDDREFFAEGLHPYFVLEPGYQTTLAGDEDGVQVVSQVTVLDQVESIDGVTTRVVEERELEDGELVQISLSFLALCDRTGDLYQFGEEEFDIIDGKPVAASDSWRAGVDGARAGVLLPATPVVGGRYLQGTAPGLSMDRAEIIDVAAEIERVDQQYEDVLLIYETSGIDREEGSLKWYAPGVGLVRDDSLEFVESRFENAREPREFQAIDLVIEQSEDEEEVEIIIDIETPLGARALSVHSPSGETLIDLRASWKEGGELLGLDELTLGSETSVEAARTAFPEGLYRFEARGIDGERYVGEARLSHAMLPAPIVSTSDVTEPESGVPRVTWESVDGAVAYVVELENDALELFLTATLSSAETCIEIPPSFLVPGLEFDIDVATVSPEGNRAISETSFEIPGSRRAFAAWPERFDS